MAGTGRRVVLKPSRAPVNGGVLGCGFAQYMVQGRGVVVNYQTPSTIEGLGRRSSTTGSAMAMGGEKLWCSR